MVRGRMGGNSGTRPPLQPLAVNHGPKTHLTQVAKTTRVRKDSSTPLSHPQTGAMKRGNHVPMGRYGTNGTNKQLPEGNASGSPSMTQPDPDELESTKSEIKVTFNPRVEDFRGQRRLSVPEEAFSMIPKSILKKRSSICLGGDLLAGFLTEAPISERFEEQEDALHSLFNTLADSCQGDGLTVSCNSVTRKPQLFWSEAFTRTLLEMKNEQHCDE